MATSPTSSGSAGSGSGSAGRAPTTAPKTVTWKRSGKIGGTDTPDSFDPADRDAYNRLKSILEQYGLGALAPKLLTYVQEGMSDDSIMLELQGTTEWKQRFIANETRRKAGMPVLSPAEYLATERAYRQIMQEAGVPSGFYDQNSDFTDFLSKDMSPAELKGRVDTAATFVRQADPQQLAYMKQFYTDGDLIAFALDSKRAAPLIEKAFKASQLGGIAAGDSLAIGKDTAEKLAAAGLDENQARAGFGSLGQDKATLDRLAGIDGQSALSADELASATFLGDSTATKKLDRMKSAERGRFAGSSGVGTGSLSKSSAL